MALGTYCGLLIGLAMAWSCAYAAYVLAIRLCPAAPTSVRCCGALLLAGWLSAAVFELLVSLHALRLWVALPVWLALAVATHAVLRDPRHAPRRQAEEDWERFREALRAICHGDVRVVLALTALVSAAVVLRGLVAPPLAWDSLTYQLVRPAMWVQTGAMTPCPAPDAWSYYAYFPYAGNIFWAWAMLPVHGEILLVPVELAIWLAALLAAYTNARLLGAQRATAVLAALCVGLTPAAFAYLTSGYVDNTALAAFLLGMVFVIRTLTGSQKQEELVKKRGQAPRQVANHQCLLAIQGSQSPFLHKPEAVLAAAGFGLAAGVKLNGVIMLALAGLLTGAYLLWRRASWRGWFGSLVAASAVVAVTLIPYLRTWAQTGSPLYPQALRLFGHEVFTGNEQFAAVLEGRIFDVAPRFFEMEFLRMTFLPRTQSTGLGPVAPVLVVFGLIGLMRLLRRPDLRLPAFVMLLCSAVAVWMVCSPAAWGMRAYWPGACARFLMPALACCALWAATVRRMPRWIWLAAIGYGLVMAVPRGWSMADLKAIGTAVAGLTVGSAGLWVARRLIRRLKVPRLATAATVLMAGAMAFPLGAVRGQYRYAIYQAADARRSWITHRLHNVYVSSWPIWEYFDTRPGRRIAVTAGWEDAGHNWYRYPLLGSQLQNRLLYVPITRDGSILNYQQLDRVAFRADFRAWIGRLVGQRADYVVVLAPDRTPESRWIQQNPDLFDLVARSTDGQSRAYRFHPSAAVERLAHGQPSFNLRK